MSASHELSAAWGCCNLLSTHATTSPRLDCRWFPWVPCSGAMMLRLSIFLGRAMTPLLSDVARLCTIVFREWPHLYDGDGRYDPDHLRMLGASPGSVLIMAYDGDTPVGASTGLPLADATRNVQAPFLARGWPLLPFF